jgi:hypothetical protein
MPFVEPNSTRYWLGIFFGTLDMPVLTAELDEFWDSMSDLERYGYSCQMQMSWGWWHRQDEYSFWEKNKHLKRAGE